MATRSVKLNNQKLELTSKEYDLLHFLITHKLQRFSREEILKAVWGEEYSDYEFHKWLLETGGGDYKNLEGLLR